MSGQILERAQIMRSAFCEDERVYSQCYIGGFYFEYFCNILVARFYEIPKPLLGLVQKVIKLFNDHKQISTPFKKIK